MALPQLYNHVTLRSYDTIRYIDGKPEGYGGASPFSIALNGLVTRNVGQLVHTFSVVGKWKEHDLEELGKVGQIPDSSILLNTVVRLAIDKMAKLESFRYFISYILIE